jgi:hypothetical protein
LLRGTTVGTVSGHQGAFDLQVEATKVDSAATLIFSFIGFRTQEVPVLPATAGPVTIAMTADLTGLNVFYVVKPSLPKRVWWKAKRAVAPRRER